MKIKWLGQAAFVVKSKEALVADPCNPIFGKLPKDLTASVITVSHAHGDHSYIKGVGGSPKIINQVGNFTAGGFEIKGIATFHDNRGGKKRGDNIVYIIHSEDLTLCHLGDLGHVLTEEQLKEIGKVDILMIPVGGFVTVGLDEAVQVVNQIKPKIVLPMHFKPKKSLIPFPFAGVDKFTESLGWKVEEVEELEIHRSALDSVNKKVVIFKR